MVFLTGWMGGMGGRGARWTARGTAGGTAGGTASSPGRLSRTVTSSRPIHLWSFGRAGRDRLEDHLEGTIQPDLVHMTTPRRHLVQSLGGATDPRQKIPARDLDDPYERGRPERRPRGKRPLIPKEMEGLPESERDLAAISGITVHAMIKEAIQDKQVLMGAITAISAMTGLPPSAVELVKGKTGVSAFKVRQGVPIGVKAKLTKPALIYPFLTTLTEFVLPRLRDFQGFPLAATSSKATGGGAGQARANGVFGFGLDKSAMALWPSIELALDSYPLLFGFHVSIHTSCKGKRAADESRILLSGLGMPFSPNVKSKR